MIYNADRPTDQRLPSDCNKLSNRGWVLCTLYSVLCTLYSVLCTLYIVHPRDPASSPRPAPRRLDRRYGALTAFLGKAEMSGKTIYEWVGVSPPRDERAVRWDVRWAVRWAVR